MCVFLPPLFSFLVSLLFSPDRVFFLGVGGRDRDPVFLGSDCAHGHVYEESVAQSLGPDT